MYQYHYRRIKKKPFYKKPLIWIVFIAFVISSAVYLFYFKNPKISIHVPVLKKVIMDCGGPRRALGDWRRAHRLLETIAPAVVLPCSHGAHLFPCSEDFWTESACDAGNRLATSNPMEGPA